VGGTQRTLGLFHLTAELLDGTLVLGQVGWLSQEPDKIYIVL
jgi:hypothetical protein